MLQIREIGEFFQIQRFFDFFFPFFHLFNWNFSRIESFSLSGFWICMISILDAYVELILQEADLCNDQDRSFLRPEKFAPRFDGLRFIETLITAHR